jgi:truncated hemoglobin YjbI
MPKINLISASLMTVLLSVTNFTAGAAVSSATPDAVSSATIALPAGKYSTLKLLASAVNGYQLNQAFVVTYTDGTTTKFTQSLSNWWGPPQHYTGESQVMEMPDLVTPSGATLQHAAYVYGYLFALNSSKTVKSITLPKNRNVVVLAVDVGANGASPLHVSLATADNVVGIVSTGTAATKGGWDNEGYSYSASLLGTSITWAGSTFTLGAGNAATSPGGPTLQISGTPPTTAEVGGFYSFTPTVVASAGSSLAFTVANKPAWAQFSATTGALSGTPSAGSAATDSNIVVSVSNGARSVALSAFQITVEAAPATVAHVASLSWVRPVENTDGSPLTNLAGYVIRYGTSPTALNTQISVASPAATSVEISNLTAGSWHFQVAAINTVNVEGQFSAVVDKTIQ